MELIWKCKQFRQHNRASEITKVVQHETAVSEVERIKLEWKFLNEPNKSTTKNKNKNESW
jgi:hypothetical protein